MPKSEAPITHLQHYLPEGTFDQVLQYLEYYRVHLTVARERKSVLGDYRHRTHQNNHRISVNGNLNKYAFLITLLHELAHLLAYEQFGHRIMAHGREWKLVYANLLDQFLKKRNFPQDIENELLQSINNPAASSCAEDGLLRVLKKYDQKSNGLRLVEELPVQSLFRLDDGRIFKKGEKIRKRFKCLEIKTGKIFLFSPVYEVELITNGI
jgi:predicted SprT family Zn-dependent metalloprotease